MIHIKSLREAAGLTQEQLAVKAGVTHATIWRIEHDHYTTLKTAAKVAKALGVPLSEILADEEVSNG